MNIKRLTHTHVMHGILTVLHIPLLLLIYAIKPFLTKGSILVFDDAICELSPGETIAIKETFGFDKISLKRWQYNSRLVYFVVE